MMNQHIHDETERLSESAWSHLEHEEYEQCIAFATQALNSNVVSADLYHCRANAFYEQKRYQEALPDYLHALKLDPTDATSSQSTLKFVASDIRTQIHALYLFTKSNWTDY